MWIKKRLSRYAPSRRRVLAMLAQLPLLAGVMSAYRAVAARAPTLDAHAQRTIAAVVDHMLPAGELPGGLALHIDQGVTATADAEMRRSLAQGVAWLDARARARHAANFLALDEAGREAVLQAALAERAADADANTIVDTLRNRAFMLYYTDKSVMAAFPYTGPPQPEGFPDFQEAPR